MNDMLIENFRKLRPLQLGVFTRDWAKPCPHERNDAAAARPAQRWSPGLGLGLGTDPTRSGSF